MPSASRITLVSFINKIYGSSAKSARMFCRTLDANIKPLQYLSAYRFVAREFIDGHKRNSQSRGYFPSEW